MTTLLLNDGSLRVRRQGSEQNLRHVLLAEGHQGHRQALIGRVHAAALKTGREVGGKGDVLQQGRRCLQVRVSDPVDVGIDFSSGTTLTASQTSWLLIQTTAKHNNNLTIYRGRGGGTGCQQCSMTGTHPVSRLYVFVPIGRLLLQFLFMAEEFGDRGASLCIPVIT